MSVPGKVTVTGLGVLKPDQPMENLIGKNLSFYIALRTCEILYLATILGTLQSVHFILVIFTYRRLRDKDASTSSRR